MILLFDFCDIAKFWWLLWLLLPLIGLLIGWLLWARYKRLLANCEADLAECRKKRKQCEEDLAECRKAYTRLENENATLRGRIRELEISLRDAEDAAKLGDVPDAANLKAQDSKVPEVDVSSKVDATPEVDLTAAANLTSNVSSFAAAGSSEQPAKSSGVASPYSKLASDNLQIIEGIGPKMEEVLKKADINTWSKLASKTPGDLKAVLGEYGRRYQIIDPTTWPAQATLASEGKWDELISMQKSLDTGKDTGGGETDAKLEKLMIKMGLIKKYKKNDLKVVEGIGPKIEQLMHNAGITTWAQMASATVEKLQSILDDAGDRYKLADPKTWPRQAQLADEGKWDELQEYQDFLQGGRG